MTEQKRPVNNGFKVEKHYKLCKATEAEIRDNTSQVFSNADQGIQTAIVAEDGKTVRAIVGLNGTRYLPDPDPNPFDEIVRKALDSSKGNEK